VRANAAASALVDVEVYNSFGQMVYQQWWDNQQFSANRSRSFVTSWTVPSSLPPGTYILKVGVFRPNWASMYIWNDSARTFTVR
jgi:hypothetical protein